MTTLTQDYYEIDPDGDVIFVFTTTDSDTANQGPCPLAVPNESTTPAEVTDYSVGNSSASVAATKPQESDQQVGNRQPDTPKDARVVRMRVSSKHLSLASPVFKKMLHGPWKEAQGLRAGHVEIKMDGQSIDAMLLLMQAIHGYGSDIPRNVSLEMVTKIATLADYYNCHKAIHLALEWWIRVLQAGVVKGYSDDHVRWIWISWVFRLTDIFRYATYRAVTQSKGPISTIGLPIPKHIIDAIETRREHCIKTTLEALRRLLTDLRDGRKSCSFECDSIRSGALTKQLHRQGFLGLVDEGAIPTISLDQLKQFLDNIKSPAWRELTSKRRRDQDQHSGHPCTLQSVIKPILSNMACHMKGYEFGDLERGQADAVQGVPGCHTS